MESETLRLSVKVSEADFEEVSVTVADFESLTVGESEIEEVSVRLRVSVRD